MIQRPRYLKKLIDLRHTKLIKVVTGIRRCGKSTLLHIYQEYLLEQGVEQKQIHSVNFEDMDYAELTDGQKLHAYIKGRLVPGKMNYVFLDEIQQVADFQKVVGSLHMKETVDVYITGSNASLLSGELATLLSGRYVEIRMLPLSFKEYLSAVGTQDLSKAYRDYLTGSSFPYAVELRDRPAVLQDYLRGVYSTVVLKDIVSRKRMSDVMMLESLIRFLFDNIGNLFSTKKIADTLTSNGRSITPHTVEGYLTALQESFIFYRAGRFDIKGKQHLKTLEKYYCVDIGLRYHLLGSRAGDVGHILENVIFLELLHREQDVYVGKALQKEIDFVTIGRSGPAYYQVAATVRDEKTLRRELEPLLAVNDQYPKFLLTLDEDPPSDYQGIPCINALEFLIDSSS